MEDIYDFGGWATRNNLLCADGRTIRKDAFKSQNGQTVPLVYNHNHNEVENVLGHGVLENREEGVYFYGKFNDSEAGRTAKELVKHGDVTSLSIYANKLKQNGSDVVHGIIREVSLVLAGANPGAFIDTVLAHGDEDGDGMIVGFDENLTLFHSGCAPKSESKKEEPKKGEKGVAESGKTVRDIIDSMTEEQQNVMYAMVADALNENEDGDGGDEEMKHNIFDQDEVAGGFLTHSDEQSIIALAKNSSVGSFQSALDSYMADNAIQHGIDPDDMETLFPDYKDVYPGEPETLTRDLTWIDKVISGVHKSPVSRVRTRQLDARQTGISQLGLTQSIMDGTADEKTMLNYYDRTIEPILSVIADEMIRKFLTKTARSRGQSIKFFRDPFKLVPVSEIAEIADKFTRNEIATSNEIRQVIGWTPSDDPNADVLRNKNLSEPSGGNTPTKEPEMEEEME